MTRNKILISINPEYVKKILNNEKLYEFRTKRPTDNINSLIIYETSPTKRVVGEVQVERIIEDTPQKIWELSKNNAGISKDKFFEYFKNKQKAYAYKLGNIIRRFDKSLSDFVGVDGQPIISPPQSFIYADYANSQEP